MGRFFKHAVALSLLFLCFFTGFGYLSQRLSGSPEATGSVIAEQLAALHSRCVQDMLASTCKVMGANPGKATAQPGELVFVAGVGAIDAIEYQALFTSGDAMCMVIRQACATEWESSQCKTARRLYL